MWLCSKCEKVPSEVIHCIRQYSELRVHWFCKLCDNFRLTVTCHMSSSSTKEITSCVNDNNNTVVKSLNKMVEDIAKTLNNTQSSFSNHCKILEDEAMAPGVMMEVSNEDDEESGNASKPELYSSVVNNQVVSIVSEISD